MTVKKNKDVGTIHVHQDLVYVPVPVDDRSIDISLHALLKCHQSHGRRHYTIANKLTTSH